MKGYYKCRLCGTSFYNCATNRKIASDVITDICIHGKSKVIQAPGMIGFHSCDDGLVRYIRQSNKSNYKLAKELGVDPSTIRDARNKKTWRHII